MKTHQIVIAFAVFTIHCSAQIQTNTIAYKIDTGFVFPADTTPDIYRILIEEYTGHLGGYCPEGDSVLFSIIKPTYHDTITIISVHAGFFAGTCPNSIACLSTGNLPAGSYTEDFTTLSGNDWNNFFSIAGNPKCMINRVDFPLNTHSKLISTMNSITAGLIHNTPKIKIRIHTEYHLVNRQLDIYTETKFLTQLNGNYKLNVVLTEDSIAAWQLNYNASNNNDSDYAQRYVLRGSLNGSFGETLNTTSPTAAGSVFLKYHSTNLQTGWNENNIHVIAFLYDDLTKEVLNVSEDNNFKIISGIRETQLADPFIIYPNPVSNSTVLHINNQLYSSEVIIYDLPGRELLRKKIANNIYEIGKENLRSGVYFVEVRNNGKKYLQKIIVQ